MTRNLVWQNEHDLWESDALNCAVNSAKANNNYAWRLMNDKKDFDKAVKHARIGVKLECEMRGIQGECRENLPKKKIGWINLRDALRLQGIEYAKAHEIKKAQENFKEITEIQPSYILGWQFYAKASARLKQNKKVNKIQSTCAKVNPKK